MANLAGIIDCDPERRREFLERLQPLLGTFPWLQHHSVEVGNAHLESAVLPTAPRSYGRDAGGAACFVLGNLARHEEGSDAERLLAHYRRKGPAGIASHNGYYLSCLWDAGEITLGADLMGLFPLYYCATPDYLLFATSPSFFRAHPSFTPKLRPEGLAGILLTTHLVGGRALWQGVQRLGIGNMLRWRPGTEAAEVKVRTLEASRTYFDQSYEHHLERVDSLLDRIVRRETAGRHTTTLLSGGLDSRLLAGYMHEQYGTGTAITLGHPDDVEMICATLVAQSLGWKQERFDGGYSTFVASGMSCVELEMLSNGLNTLLAFRDVETIRGGSPWLLTGFIGDSIMGGGHVPDDYDDSQDQLTYERRFQTVTRHGFPPELIRRLVRPEALTTSLESAVDGLKRSYEEHPGLPFQKSWMFELSHRVRFHTTASILIRPSYGSWPISPFADEELVTTMLGMPVSTLLNRRIERDLLCRRFPALAKLPLDRNSMDMSPLLLGPREVVMAWLKRLTRYPRRRRQLRKWLGIPDIERLYYYRIHDLNNPGWAALRREAEPHRKKAETVLDPATLRELLPPPDIPIHLPDGIIDGANRKVLLGFLLWAGRNL